MSKASNTVLQQIIDGHWLSLPTPGDTFILMAQELQITRKVVEAAKGIKYMKLEGVSINGGKTIPFEFDNPSKPAFDNLQKALTVLDNLEQA